MSDIRFDTELSRNGIFGTMHRNKERGFSLIELLVVISIISIMGAVVMASLSVARAKGRDARRLVDIKQIVTALELYYDANNSFPCSSGENSQSGTMLSTLVTNKFLNHAPKDPTNRGAYMYYYSTFKKRAGGPCGQIFQINFDRQAGATLCPYSGLFVTPTHCHFFYPTALPCSDPYLINEASMAADCLALKD